MTGWRDKLPGLGDVQSAYRFLTRIPPILRRPISAAEAYAKLAAELAQRENNFLALTRQGIFANPQSPYLALMRHAGCDYTDLEQLVRREGLEGALRMLLRKGVYLTVNELKGRVAVVRGSTQFTIAPSALRDPAVEADWYGHTGASRGATSFVPMQLAMLREHAMARFAELDQTDRRDWVCATWSVPGVENLRRLIEYSLCGVPIARWFWLIDAGAADLHPRYLWSARVLRCAGNAAGVSFPTPEYVSPQDPRPIVAWMSAVLRSGKIPFLHSYPSSVARLCQTAIECGTSLQGARFAMGGEPTTPGRLVLVRRAGAQATSQYSSGEAGHIGRGCIAPVEDDEVHIIGGRCAVIQPGELEIPSLPPNALLMTSTVAKARLILLNVSLGDQAVLTKRDCGCPLQRLGWSNHLHDIRSFEKLTAGGVTFLDCDLIRVLENDLPAHFGGGPTDYQLVDEETADGAPRLRLLVHPRIGPLDAGQIRQTFLDAIGHGSGVEKIMTSVWRDAALPTVERAAPKITPGGKILHVHLERAQAV